MEMRMTREMICEYLEIYGCEEALLLDGYEEAFIGVNQEGGAVYDYGKMVDCLISKEKWTRDDAEEWISYNTLRALDYVSGVKPTVIFPVV